MRVGIGLPATIPGVEGHELIEWARRAEDAGFPSLGVLDRIVYPNYEPLVTLGAVAAVTERIALTTAIAILPYRHSAALVAKQAATVHHLSGGRLVFGVAVGGRPDDYGAAGASMATRGSRLEEMLDEIKRLWAGEARGVAGGVGPDVSDDPPPILVGGTVDAAFDRAARYGDGWIMGGGTPVQFRPATEKLETAWRAAGRDGEPRKRALAYFSLGADAEEQAQRSVGHYYTWLGDYADQIVASVATDEETVRQYVQAFNEVGCDELLLFPSSSDPEQVDLLAAAVR